MRRQWRAVLGLSLCAATVASAGLITPQLLSQKQKDECQLETQRLYHCSTFTAPDSPLTDHQRDLCCEALNTFNQDNCFCGWGDPAAMNPWTRDVLGDLACALYSCGLEAIPCKEEEYLQDAINPAAYYVGPEMQALQTASAAVSKMANEEVWAIGQRLPERLATTLQPLLDLKFISRLLPGGNAAPGGDDWKRDGQPSEFDIELEVEQDGGDAEELWDTMQQLTDWLAALLSSRQPASSSVIVHDSDQHGEMDPPVDSMDRTDSLAFLLKHAIELISTVLNGTEAQVEVAVEITMETTTSMQAPQKTSIASAVPLISRVLMPSDSADSSTSMLYQHSETELVASPAAEQRQHNGCIVKRIAQAARENPARVFAVLAGIAFICLLGTFVAQVVLTIVCGVQQQLEAREEVIGIVVNPLLEPELMTPLLNVQGELRRGYSQS